MVLLPPMSPEDERRFREWREANAVRLPARPAAAGPESVLAEIEGNPHLVIGRTDGELVLWRCRTDKTEPAPLADLTLHLVGSEPSELYAGKRFAGLLWQARDRALLHPDWLRDIGGRSGARRAKSRGANARRFRCRRGRPRNWNVITARPCPYRPLAYHQAVPRRQHRAARAARRFRGRLPRRERFRMGSRTRTPSRASVGNSMPGWRRPVIPTCTRPCAGVPLLARTTARAPRSMPGDAAIWTSPWRARRCSSVPKISV